MTLSATSKNPSFFWNLFTSLKLTLGLLLALAATSIFGTVIPQQEGAMALAERLSPALVRILSSLQLFDMYHSWWFRVLIGALVINLIICSLDRFPAALKRFQAAPNLDRSKPFETLGLQTAFQADAEMDRALVLASGILKRRYKRTHEKHSGNGVVLHAEKGRISYLGVYLVHLSVLIILIGGLIGSLFGFEAYVNIPEGETINQVRLRKSQAYRPLPFSVRCHRFSLQLYDNGQPKEYRSDLVFIRNGKTALHTPLRVNHPVTFEGITFYQSAYGSMPGDKARIHLRREDVPMEKTLEVEFDKPYDLPGAGGQFMVLGARSDFMKMGPAVQVAVKSPDGEEVRFWIFQNTLLINDRFPGFFERFPKFNPAAYKPYRFFLERVETRYYTGLQVSRDPGVPLVWSGFSLIMVGLFITFFTSHRSIWIQIVPTLSGVNVRIAGKAHKNPAGIERELTLLAARMKKRLEKKPETPAG